MKIDALNLNTEIFNVENLQNTHANRRLMESFSAQNDAIGLEK